MTELVNAWPLHERGPHVNIAVLDATPFGNHEQKRFLECNVGGAAMSLIERPFNQDFLRAWIAFKAADMPVPEKLWHNTDRMFLEDIKAGGGEVYGKEFLMGLRGQRQRFRARPKIDSLFLEYTQPAKFGAIATQMESLVDRANAKNLILPFDDPFELLIQSDGSSWGLITLDLMFGGSYNPRYRRPQDVAEYQTRNRKRGNGFLNWLCQARHLCLDAADRSDRC